MNSENPNPKKIAEPVTEYKSVKPQKGIGKGFDFDKEFAEGLTVEEAKKLSKTLIRSWRKK